MKKTFVLISFILISIIFPFKTKAYCTFNDKSRLMKQAGNINSVYVFDDDSKTFTITFNNIPNGFMIKKANEDEEYKYKGEELTLRGFKPGLSYRFEVYDVDSECLNSSLKSFYITLPVYNLNYSNELCDGLKNYSICQKWGKYIIDESDFRKEIKRIKSKEEENKKQLVIEKSNPITQIIRLIQKYYFIEIPFVIFIFVIIYRKNKKGKSL